MVNESHIQRSQFFNIDAKGKNQYGQFNPCVEFVSEQDGPQIRSGIHESPSIIIFLVWLRPSGSAESPVRGPLNQSCYERRQTKGFQSPQL